MEASCKEGLVTVRHGLPFSLTPALAAVWDTGLGD